jgi:hypothetical protein
MGFVLRDKGTAEKEGSDERIIMHDVNLRGLKVNKKSTLKRDKSH